MSRMQSRLSETADTYPNNPCCIAERIETARTFSQFSVESSRCGFLGQRTSSRWDHRSRRPCGTRLSVFGPGKDAFAHRPVVPLSGTQLRGVCGEVNRVQGRVLGSARFGNAGCSGFRRGAGRRVRLVLRQSARKGQSAGGAGYTDE